MDSDFPGSSHSTIRPEFGVCAGVLIEQMCIVYLFFLGHAVGMQRHNPCSKATSRPLGKHTPSQTGERPLLVSSTRAAGGLLRPHRLPTLQETVPLPSSCKLAAFLKIHFPLTPFHLLSASLRLCLKHQHLPLSHSCPLHSRVLLSLPSALFTL